MVRANNNALISGHSGGVQAAILKILQCAGCNIKNIAACFRKFNVVN